MRKVVRQSLKASRRNAFSQHYKSIVSYNVFNIISGELDLNANICEILEKYFEFLSKYEKTYAKEFDENMMNIEILFKWKKLTFLIVNLKC